MAGTVLNASGLEHELVGPNGAADQPLPEPKGDRVVTKGPCSLACGAEVEGLRASHVMTLRCSHVAPR
eukprot:8740880-Heterocapsa_arctica.AAC.1